LRADIIIDPEFQTWIPPLLPEELTTLEESLLRDGCRDALPIWETEGKSVLLDGHNRYTLCQKHGVEFRTTVITIKDRNHALLWIGENQLGRRNLTDGQRAALTVELLDLKRVIAGKIVKQYVGDDSHRQRQKRKTVAPSHKPGARKKRADSRKTLSQEKKVTTQQIQNARAVKNLSPDLYEQVRGGAITLPEAKKRARQQRQRRVLADIVQTEIAAPTGKFSLLLADPPWRYDFAEADNRKVENQYPTMSVEDICALAVPAAANSVLFLWATAPKLREALQVMERWGFEYQTHAIWDKKKIGMGYWFRGQHELLLLGTKNSFPAPEGSLRPPSIFKETRKKHSEKPEAAYTMIEEMYPNFDERHRVELFQRNPRPKWSGWGNQ
jgi:N6-adenosine-specific RNA methylase IME4